MSIWSFGQVYVVDSVHKVVVGIAVDKANHRICFCSDERRAEFLPDLMFQTPPTLVKRGKNQGRPDINVDRACRPLRPNVGVAAPKRKIIRRSRSRCHGLRYAGWGSAIAVPGQVQITKSRTGLKQKIAVHIGRARERDVSTSADHGPGTNCLPRFVYGIGSLRSARAFKSGVRNKVL